jgi:hypothetical protein
MNVEIGTEAEQFFFWEYLFLIFGILSLQCIIQNDSPICSISPTLLCWTQKMVQYMVNAECRHCMKEILSPCTVDLTCMLF